MSDNPFITIRYLDDNRMVEEQCEALSPVIESGAAVPMEQSRAVYDAWAEKHGKEVPEFVPDPGPEEEAVEEAEIVRRIGGGKSEPETTDEAETEIEEEAAVDPAEADGDEDPPAKEADEYEGLPEGYTARQYGSWHVVYDPDGKKVGKGRKTPADAVTAACEHAGL